MLLNAQLTIGWHTSREDPLSALRLYEDAANAGENFADALSGAIQTRVGNAYILGLELLFRRHPGGFDCLKQFLGTLVSIPGRSASDAPLLCQIDAFAYSFLKGAKNIDLVLPLGKEINSEFWKTVAQWRQAILALEDFERLGIPIKPKMGISVDQYLALRDILTRPSARDERRALATLLVSGPSTLEEISQDLALNYSLGQRTMAAFCAIGVVNGESGGMFCIAAKTLPLVVFGLRESMGIDLLSSLKEDR